MKNRKRIFRYAALALTALLLVTMLAACGGGKSGATSSGSANYYPGAAPQAAAEAKSDSAMPMEEEWTEEADYEIEEPMEPAPEPGEGSLVTEENIPDPSAKMIYTANLSIQTLEYDQALAEILKRVADAGGFIESQNESNNNYNWFYDEAVNDDRYASITARIPAGGFQNFLNGLEEIGHVTNKSMSAENVTQRYYDTEATIKAYEIERDRLLAMMEKAETIEDMIAVESRLTEVERYLNSYKTDLSYLDKQVRYSTVYIYLDEVQKYSAAPQKTFLERFTYSLGDSWDEFVYGLQDFVIGFIYFFPTLIILIVIALVIIFLIRRFRNEEKAAARRARKAQKKTEKAARKAEKAAEKAAGQTGQTAEIAVEKAAKKAVEQAMEQKAEKT